jgi:hypothetical protein
LALRILFMPLTILRNCGARQTGVAVWHARAVVLLRRYDRPRRASRHEANRAPCRVSTGEWPDGDID